jgi:gamma-glutamylputrescine oxidase
MQTSVGFEDSWYYATARGLADHPPLEERISADVCVVGAGYTGLSAALELAERGYAVVLLEAYRVGSGASGRNGGVLGMGQRKEQDALERWLGADTARLLWDLALEANALVRQRIERHSIDCDLKDGELHAAHRRRYVATTGSTSICWPSAMTTIAAARWTTTRSSSCWAWIPTTAATSTRAPATCTR